MIAQWLFTSMLLGTAYPMSQAQCASALVLLPQDNPANFVCVQVLVPVVADSWRQA